MCRHRQTRCHLRRTLSLVWPPEILPDQMQTRVRSRLADVHPEKELVCRCIWDLITLTICEECRLFGDNYSFP